MCRDIRRWWLGLVLLLLLLPSPAHINPILLCYKNENGGWENVINISPYLPLFSSLPISKHWELHCTIPTSLKQCTTNQWNQMCVREREQLINFQDLAAQTCLPKSEISEGILPIIGKPLSQLHKENPRNSIGLSPKLLYPKKQRNTQQICITLNSCKTSVGQPELHNV